MKGFRYTWAAVTRTPAAVRLVSRCARASVCAGSLNRRAQASVVACQPRVAAKDMKPCGALDSYWPVLELRAGLQHACMEAACAPARVMTLATMLHLADTFSAP